MKLTKLEYSILVWSANMAKELRGVHTGGPYEQAYNDKLRDLRHVLLRIKPRPKRKYRRKTTENLGNSPLPTTFQTT